MRLFVDTNIVFDFLLDSQGPFRLPATTLFKAVARGTATAVISTSQATDIYYSLRKTVGDTPARDCLRKLFSLCELTETPPHACVDALDSPLADYEDAVQVETAAASACDYIITRDAKDYTDSKVPHMDASGIVELMGW